MYHSLVRSGKIKRNNDDKPRALDRSRLRHETQQQQTSESSTAVADNHNKRKVIKSSPEPKKKKYRKSGIPLEAPPFASPNTINAARVLMSVTSNSITWPEQTSDVTTESTTMDKHLLLDKDESNSTTSSTVSALPTTIDHAVPEPDSNTVCIVHIVNNNYYSSKEEDVEQQPQQLDGFVTLPSTCLTFAQARKVLQTELLAQQQQRLRQTLPTEDWSFTVPGQGRLTTEQEGKLRIDFLVTPETLGTAFSPLHVTIQVAAPPAASNDGDDDDVRAASGTETTMAV